MNASISLYEQGPTESDQVRAIWEEVGVGSDGFLDINELAVVCEHIGMEDMDRDVSYMAMFTQSNKACLHSA